MLCLRERSSCVREQMCMTKQSDVSENECAWQTTTHGTMLIIVHFIGGESSCAHGEPDESFVNNSRIHRAACVVLQTRSKGTNNDWNYVSTTTFHWQCNSLLLHKQKTKRIGWFNFSRSRQEQIPTISWSAVRKMKHSLASFPTQHLFTLPSLSFSSCSYLQY